MNLDNYTKIGLEELLLKKQIEWYNAKIRATEEGHEGKECCHYEPVSAAGSANGIPLSHLACCMCRHRVKK